MTHATRSLRVSVELSSSARELRPHALTDPDVNLSIHPALIVQPPPPRSSGQTTRAAGIGSPTATPKLAPDVWKETYISAVPTAPAPHQHIAAPAREPTVRTARS